MPRKELTHEEKLSNAWSRIKTIHREKDATGTVECHILKPGPGIVKNKHCNTFKVSLGKTKRLAHRVAYEYCYGTIDEKLDVSHLCHNDRCVKKSHLHQESHKANMERLGCPGWVKLAGTNKFMLACTHSPSCKKVTEMTSRVVDKLEEKDM